MPQQELVYYSDEDEEVVIGRSKWNYGREKNLRLNDDFLLTFYSCQFDHNFEIAKSVRDKTYSEIIEQRFSELAEKWKKETGAFSTTIHKISNKHYQEIIAMGAAVLPFILKDLENYSVWFVALRELAKENPVPKDAVGDTKRMREIWLAWGKAKGII